MNFMRPRASVNPKRGVITEAVEYKPQPRCRGDGPLWSRGQWSTGRTEITKPWEVGQEKGGRAAEFTPAIIR